MALIVNDKWPCPHRNRNAICLYCCERSTDGLSQTWNLVQMRDFVMNESRIRVWPSFRQNCQSFHWGLGFPQPKQITTALAGFDTKSIKDWSKKENTNANEMKDICWISIRDLISADRGGTQIRHLSAAKIERKWDFSKNYWEEFWAFVWVVHLGKVLFDTNVLKGEGMRS
jgi:hypothetical protein